MVSIPRRRLLSTVGLLALAGTLARRDLYRRFAPPSGAAWDGLYGEQRVVESPHGRAEVYYDDWGVPHIDAGSEPALYFATGYVHARDRLFQMDLIRRNMRGDLSAAFGERTVESDRFRAKMDFAGAAAASWDALDGTAVAPAIRAFADGVNRYLDAEPLPLEFDLLGYEPDRWRPVDTLLVSKQISWGLTGTFWDLKRSVVADRLGEDALELYPGAYEHDYPIIRPEIHGTGAAPDAEPPPSGPPDDDPIPRELVDWLDDVGGRSDAVGSNNWIVSGEHTDGGPLLANDPHLPLTAPPVWYEVHQRTPDTNVRGVALPGVPLVVIGQNERVAWGFTNVGADVIDFYAYETRNGGREYRYGGEWRGVESTTETVAVADGEDREVEVRKTVHGPLVEREGREVAVSWVGLSATREPLAIYRYNHAAGIDDFREGLRVFDTPGQNTVYIDADGNTLYYPAARYPIRRVAGEPVAGNRVFDGSAGEGEWEGFTPYGRSTWEGFIPFEEIPHLENPDYVATANQRVLYDYEHYLGDSRYIGDPYRATRIYRRLDEAVEDGTVDAAFTKDLQRDLHSVHADLFVPRILDATDRMSERARAHAERLADWNRTMRADSAAALVYARWVDHFRDVVLKPRFGAADLDGSYYPDDWPLQHLEPDSRWFDDPRTDGRETFADAAARAMERAAEEIEREGYETYGDSHRLAIDHPFDLGFLNYPRLPADGSGNTVFNVHDDGAAGSSWRMIVRFDGPSYAVLPGGNSGRYFSPHYDDQLDLWRRGGYKRMGLDIEGEKAITFVEGR